MPRPLWYLIPLALLVYLACFNSLQVGQHVDDASYVMLAQSLLTGHGYSQVAYPDNPPESKYPPLLPLLIAPFLWLTGGALWATRLPALLCALASLPVLYTLLRRLLPDQQPWLLLTVVALHPVIVGYAGMAMTEAPSLLLSWALLLLLLPSLGALQRRPCSRASLPASEAVSGAPARLSPKTAAALGFLLGLGLLLRTDTLALAAAVLLCLLLSRQWRATLHVLILMLAVYFPWHYHVSHLGASGGMSYLAELKTGWWDPSPLPLRLWHGLTRYAFDALPQMVGLVFGTTLEAKAAALGLAPVITALKITLGFLVIAGFARTWRTFPVVISLFVLIRFAMLVPWPLQTRYLLPLLPFLILYLLSGLSWLVDRIPRLRFSPRAQHAVLALLLIFALGRDALLVVRPPRLLYPDLVRGGRMIQEHVPPDAVVAASWSAKSFYLYSGHTAREVSLSAGPLSPDALLRQLGDTRYLLLARGPNDPPRDLAALLHDPRFAVQAEENGLTLLKITQ
ncbi:MAG: glycosyltransferase family 39 protein [Armatimonadia bacterium]